MPSRIMVPVEAPKLNIPEIREIGAFYYNDEPNVLYVKCEPNGEYTGPCPQCGCFNYFKHGTANIRHIHDISIGTTSIDIMLRQDRFKCKEWLCEASFVRPFDFVDSGIWMTKRLINLIQVRAMKESFTNIAEEFGVTIPTVAKILKAYGGQLESQRKLVAPKVLGIDEVHIKHRMRGVFVDIEEGKLIEMTVNNKKETIKKAIESLQGYQNIQVVTMDMTNGYKSVIEEILPKAVIVVDKFHVVAYIYKATVYAKQRIVEQIKDQIDKMPESADKKRKDELIKRLGKDSYLFKFGNDKLGSDPDRLALMALLCKEFPELNQLRLVKMYAEKIYNSEDATEATKAIQDFRDNVPMKDPNYREFKKFSKMIERWLPEIMNYFIYGKEHTNATTEGVNSLIKHINGVGRGYSFDTLRYKCLYQPEGRKTLKSRPKPNLGTAFGYATISRDEFTYETDIGFLNEHFDDIF